MSDHARDVLRSADLVAIIHPRNTASLRVAEKIGMTHVEDDRTGIAPEVFAALGVMHRTVMGMRLATRRGIAPHVLTCPPRP